MIVPDNPELGAQAAAPRTEPAVSERSSRQVIEALRATGYVPLRDLGVMASQGTGVLCGRVPSYYLKQLAQSALLSVPGIDQVRNEIDASSLCKLR